MISLLHVFLIPVGGGTRRRERLETALSRLAQESGQDIQDPGIHYKGCRPDEGPLVFCLPPLPIAGLDRLSEIRLPLEGLSGEWVTQ